MAAAPGRTFVFHCGIGGDAGVVVHGVVLGSGTAGSVPERVVAETAAVPAAAGRVESWT